MDRSTSLTKALDLLTLLRAKNVDYSIQEMADAMNQPRSTVVRVLNTLVEYGLIEKRVRRYRCGEGFNRWASMDRHAVDRLRYRSLLQTVSAATGELVLLGVQDGAGIVHIDYIESDYIIRVAPAPHTRHNIRHNALGKLCIAQRPDLRKEWVQGDPDFAVELDAIRRTGVAWNREESVKGMIAMATYGFNRNPPEPKIAVAWPVQRFTEEKGQQAEQLIRNALAKCISDMTQAKAEC